MADSIQQRQLHKRQGVLNGLYAAVEAFAPDAPVPDPFACRSKRDWERRMFRLREALRKARAIAHWGSLVRELLARPRKSALGFVACLASLVCGSHAGLRWR